MADLTLGAGGAAAWTGVARLRTHRVWPDFDWQSEFDGFVAEHLRNCTGEELESSPGLGKLAGLIQRDEVHHYRHFYRYFNKYNRVEPNNRAQMFGALARRLRVILRSDVERGSWYPYQARHAHASRNGREFRRAMARTTTLVRRHYPAPMAIKMLLKPLALPPVLNRLSHRTVLLAHRLILR